MRNTKNKFGYTIVKIYSNCHPRILYSDHNEKEKNSKIPASCTQIRKHFKYSFKIAVSMSIH